MNKILLLIAILSANGINANEVRISDRIKTETIKLTSDNRNKVKEYNFKINKKQLGRYLGLNENDTIQLDNVYNTYEQFCDGMLIARNEPNDKTRLNTIFNSIDNVIEEMASKLNKVQYRNFLTTLNIMLYNNGFWEESSMHSK